MSTLWFPLVAVLALGAEGPRPQPLERELLRVAKELVKELKDRGYANVGVLKFRVSKDGQALSDHAGTLNLFLARRLEVALVLANDPRRPLGIIDNATAVAHRTRGTNHLTREGRRKLFEARYPLAWGKEEVSPDAFVTGIAQVGPDLKTLEVSLFVFDQKKNKLEPVGKDFKALLQPGQLAELGESFSTRGLFDAGAVNLVEEKAKEEKVVQSAAKVKEGKATHPANDPQAPVKLEVRYDGRPVPLEVRDGKAFVPEPREAQAVELVLKRDNSGDRYGAVLKVNGENTLFKERLSDLECKRWILDQGHGPLTVKGYQVNADEVEKFRVLSAPESKEREISYGADIGMITLTVFTEWKGKPPDLSDEAKEAAVVAKGRLGTTPEKGEPDKPSTFAALKARLLEDANRGLSAEGQRGLTGVALVRFVPDPVPVLTLTVIYYHPQDLPGK